MNYETLYDLFDKKRTDIDETSFYFRNDPLETIRYIGYLPEYEEPYWAGHCDISDGCSFKTAKELFEAPVFDGKSIKDRWNDIVLYEIGGVDADEWKMHLSPADIK